MFLDAASDIARATDGVFFVITAICVVLLLVITFLMVYFVARYGRRKHPEALDNEGNVILEVSWTAGGVILVLFMFYLGWGGYKARTQVPPGAMEVDVTGRMWAWTFAYPNGRESGRLILPVGEPVRLALGSADVIHSVYIPAFRVKQDVVPGDKKVLWFTPDTVGEFDLFCAEYCGTGHSRMTTTVEVMSRDGFDAWYAAAAAPTGRELYESKGCSGCHSVDGSPGIGPTWKGLYGHEVVVTTGGRERTLIATGDYIRRSIVDPASDVVKGYAPIMPELPLDDGELDLMVEYIKSLSPAPGPEAGEGETEEKREEKTEKKVDERPSPPVPAVKEEKAPPPAPVKKEPAKPAPAPAVPEPAPEPEPAPAVKEEPVVEEAVEVEKGMEEPASEDQEMEEGPEPAAEEPAADSAEKAPAGPSPGEVVYREKACIGCHTLDGSRLVGPTWKGLYGKEAVVMTDGVKRTVVVDEEYIRKSIREPSADIVEGYPPSMPAIELSEDEISSIVDLIKALR